MTLTLLRCLLTRGSRGRLRCLGRKVRALRRRLSFLRSRRVDGEAVMHLHVAKRAEVQHERWAPFGVCSLRAGSWMLRLNELAACLRTADERHADAAEKMGDATASRRSPLASSPPSTDDEYGGGKTQGPGSPDEPTHVARAQASDW